MTSMRKHVVIVSEESVLSGHYHCGIGEVADTLAEALRYYYDVTLITVGKRTGGYVRSTITLGVEGNEFTRQAAECINSMRPDLVHNLDADPTLIDLLTVDCPTIYTFDRWEFVADKLDLLRRYTHVTTVSQSYAAQVMEADPDAADLGVVGITNGISGGFYHRNDAIWGRGFYCKTLGIDDAGKPLILSMGRLTPAKGVQDIIDAAPDIAAAGAQMVVYGRGDADMEAQLQTLHDAGTLRYVPRMVDYFEMMSALHAADWYLMPSITEACGLQALKAAHIGAVPIVRPSGGLQDSFDETNAILITDSITEAVRRALALSESDYAALRKSGMEAPVTWQTRVLPWVELYGLPAEPRPVTPPSSGHGGETASNYAAEEPYRLCPFARTEETTNE